MIFFMLVPILLPAQTATFRAGVALVKVDAAVTDHNGRTISGLVANDFEVYDENAPQRIVYFEHEADPLNLLLLLDVSGSMHHSLGELAATARAALHPLGASDRVAVMLFARTSALRRPFTSDFDAVQGEIRSAIDTQDLGSGTAINAAIVAAAAQIGRENSNGRRAILIVTDNLSLNYRIPDEQVLRALYAADATLNAILIGRQRRPEPAKPGAYVNTDFTPSDVFKLARQTGGEAMESRKASESFPLMIERIRSRYRLQYAAPPAAPGEFRRIRVQPAPAARSRHAGAVIQARAGYYAAE
jgi:VWFA-related protein